MWSALGKQTTSKVLSWLVVVLKCGFKSFQESLRKSRASELRVLLSDLPLILKATG